VTSQHSPQHRSERATEVNSNVGATKGERATQCPEAGHLTAGFGKELRNDAQGVSCRISDSIPTWQGERWMSIPRLRGASTRLTLPPPRTRNEPAELTAAARLLRP
jgi:hypothetical protein